MKIGKAAVPVAAIAAVLVAVLGPGAAHGVSASEVARYVAAVLTGATAVIHAPKVAKKVAPRHGKRRAPPAFSMFDTIDPSLIPPRPQAVAGYVGGYWPTYSTLLRDFPHAKHLSIAVNAGEDAECLDVENGDATPAQAPAWCRRQRARGVSRPVIYASVATMPAVLGGLAADGITRGMVRVWTAHYTGRQHLCSQACWPTLHTVADATQFTDRALGRNLDESWCSGTFL